MPIIFYTLIFFSPLIYYLRDLCQLMESVLLCFKATEYSINWSSFDVYLCCFQSFAFINNVALNTLDMCHFKQIQVYLILKMELLNGRVEAFTMSINIARLSSIEFL